MIKLTDYNGREHYLAPEAIARITQAGTSSAWHGIQSYVRTFDGETLEVRETPQEIARQVREDRP